MILNNSIKLENFEEIKKRKDFFSIDFNSPIVFKNFKDFYSIKENALRLIKNSDNVDDEYNEKNFLKISRSDFTVSHKDDREWLKYLEYFLAENILELCSKLGFSAFSMRNIWFQQYESESFHDWHVHEECHYSGVFYLEMPEDGPKTEFINPITNETFRLEMNEGDIAIFPAYLPHRSSRNESKDRKTIISFNISLVLFDEDTEKINNIIKK
jgi:hypothetical protein